ncbi:MAG: sensor histidine kinase [Gemmatimonadaceae bacterium]
MFTRPPRTGHYSIRTELWLGFAILGVAVLAVAIAAVELTAGRIDSSNHAGYLMALVAGGVLVFVVLAAVQVERAILRPLKATAAAAEAIADGDLKRRVPVSRSIEFVHLSTSVNRVTDHLLAERAHLIRAEKLASVGRLAAGVAHEIRNPLGAITGYAHQLRRVATDDDALTAVDGLQREADRIDRIVRGLLDYGRAHPRATTPVDLNDAVRSVHELLAVQGVLRPVSVSLDLTAEALHVRADRHEMEQVFVNLFLNAVDAMPEGGELAVRTAALARQGVAIRASRRRTDDADTYVPRPPSMRVMQWLAERQPGDVVKVVVADSGPPVSPEASDEIFDPLLTASQPGRGSGLGLAIVARIVEQCGGIVWVEPSRAGGAAFHLLLPLDFG